MMLRDCQTTRLAKMGGEGAKISGALAPMLQLLPLVTPVDPLADGCD
jgi:hypothetical protein